MARADSGGFDLGLHLALDKLRDDINALLDAAKPQALTECSFGIPLLDALITINTKFTIDDITATTVRADNADRVQITMTCSTTGTWVTWPDAFYGLFPRKVDGVTEHPLACTLSIVATPITVGSANGMRFVGARFDENAVTVTIDKGTPAGPATPGNPAGTEAVAGTLEQIDGILAWLSHIDLLTPPKELIDWVGEHLELGDWLSWSRDMLYQVFCSRIAGAVHAVLNKLPDAVLEAGSSRPFVPLAYIPNVVADVQFAAADGHELRVLIAMEDGEPRSAREITRSPIRRSSDGTAIDIAGLVVGNHYILRTVVKPIVQLGLGLSAEGFDPGHPCHWWATQPTWMPPTAKILDMVPLITRVHGGIDGNQIAVTIDFSATHSTGAYGVTGSMRVPFTLPLITEGGKTGRILHLMAPVPVMIGIDVSVAWWAYLVPGLTAPVAALILLLHDVFAGPALANSINTAITNALIPALGNGSIDLALPKVPIHLSPIGLVQDGPKHQWVALHYPGLPPGCTVPMLDAEPENDAIVTFF